MRGGWSINEGGALQFNSFPWHRGVAGKMGEGVGEGTDATWYRMNWTDSPTSNLGPGITRGSDLALKMD